MSGTPWTMPQWSSGSGIIQTDNGASLTSASQLDNSFAWVRITMPGGSGREFIFQRSNTATSSGGDLMWRIKYTPTGGFVEGSPSVTQPPSAAVQGAVIGSLSDSSLTFAATMGAPPGGTANRFFICADNAAPFGWYAASVYFVPGSAGTGGSVQSMNQWFCDPLMPGSYPPEELDPYVVSGGQEGASANVNWFSQNLYRDDGNYWMVRGFLGPLISNNFTGIQAPIYTIEGTPVCGSTISYAGFLGTNQFTYKDDLLRLVWARRLGLASPTGYKGVSSMFAYSVVPRVQMDTISVNTTRDRIMIGNTWLPWDGSMPKFG